MTTALEVELKTYAHQMVADHVKEEYDSQIRKKWQPMINQLVDAQAEALKRHQDVLDKVRKQQAEQLEALYGLSMLALSFVAGPILSWVGGKIQYNWYPKYKTSSTFKKREVIIDSHPSLSPRVVDLFEKDHNHDKVHAKIFGDLGAQVAGLGIDKALKVTAPNPAGAKNKVQAAAMSPQASFKTSLENALLAEADLTSNAIMGLAMSILQNQDYGADCLAKLKRVNAAAKRANITKRELEALAKQMIREDLNKQRKEWADKWFYYGNDPVWTGQEIAAMERELWGLWLLNENLQPYSYDITDNQDGVRVGTINTSKGLTFGNPGVPELVLRKLAEFGVVEARTQLQKLQAIVAKEARDQLDAARERKEDEEAAEAYRKALEAAEGAEDPARDRNQVTRQQYDYNKQRLARRAQERKKNGLPAPIVVGDNVDTQAEIDALNNWALHHASMGGPKFVKRALPSVEDVHQ